MRHCAFLFRLFLIGYSCGVYFSACTQASSLKKSDDESPRAEQWGSDDKRILQADDPEPILTEDRGISPAVGSIGMVKAMEMEALISKLNRLKMVKGVWTILRRVHTFFQYKRLMYALRGGFEPAMLGGFTPLKVKKIFYHPTSGFKRTEKDSKEYNQIVEKYFTQFDGLYKTVPESGMDKWNAALVKMSPTQQSNALDTLSNVRNVLKSNPSVEEMIDLEISPFVYMRLLDKDGAFANNDAAAINKLKDYVDAFKKRVDLA